VARKVSGRQTGSLSTGLTGAGGSFRMGLLWAAAGCLKGLDFCQTLGVVSFVLLDALLQGGDITRREAAWESLILLGVLHQGVTPRS